MLIIIKLFEKRGIPLLVCSIATVREYLRGCACIGIYMTFNSTQRVGIQMVTALSLCGFVNDYMHNVMI